MDHSFDVTSEQPQAAQMLRYFLSCRRLPHALLFTGIEGVGKRAAAGMLAGACNCMAARELLDESLTSCGSCSICRRVQAGGHPDILNVAPQGAAIKIGQIRELLQTLALKPFEASHRFVIVSQAEKLNPAAANAFLKILEEPPPQTFLILITEQKADVLPTIQSRCQIVHFKPIQTKILQQKLLLHRLCAPEQAVVIANMAGGSWTRARRYTQADWLQRRDWLLGAFEQLAQRPLRYGLALAEKLADDATMADTFLLIMEGWLRDIIIIRYDQTRILNQDRREQLEAMAAVFSDEDISRRLQALYATRRNLQFSTNKRLSLEMLLLQLR